MVGGGDRWWWVMIDDVCVMFGPALRGEGEIKRKAGCSNDLRSPGVTHRSLGDGISQLVRPSSTIGKAKIGERLTSFQVGEQARIQASRHIDRIGHLPKWQGRNFPHTRNHFQGNGLRKSKILLDFSDTDIPFRFCGRYLIVVGCGVESMGDSATSGPEGSRQMDNGKRYYVLDRSVREFAGTILECDLLQNWRNIRDTDDAPVQEWVTYAELGDELTDSTHCVRVIRTR